MTVLITIFLLSFIATGWAFSNSIRFQRMKILQRNPLIFSSKVFNDAEHHDGIFKDLVKLLMDSFLAVMV